LKKQLYDYLYWEDPSSEATKILNSTHFNRLSQVRHVEVQSAEPKYQVTKLANGVTVLTESTTVPANVQLGILVDVGTRDETAETSGSLLSIKNTYMKTVLNTNETVNYGVHQMSGGTFDMDYDRESTYWRASCLAHDVVDVFSMIVDCAFEPRSVVAANVGIYKNTQSHKLDSISGGNNEFNDGLYRLAYGNKGLGNSLLGNKSNISNLTAQTLQKFQIETLSPHKITICGGGIDNHQ
jgi:predicted Zn-dependent peptidase